MRLQKYLNGNSEYFFDNITFSQFFCFESINTDIELSICNHMDFCRTFEFDGTKYIFVAGKQQHEKYNIFSIGVRQNNGNDDFMPTGDKGYVGGFYSGTLKCIQELVKKMDVDVLIFKTFDKKLSRLYDIMSRKNIKKLHGFRYEKKGDDFLYIKNDIGDL